MAKQLVNPLERHVEKIVLGVAALILIGAAVKYVFSSPNRIMLGQQESTPATIDSRLAQKANDILQRLRKATPSAVEHDPVYDEFAAALAPIKGEPLPLAGALGPEVPLIDTPEGLAGRAKLVTLQPPAKPAVTFGRNTLLIQVTDGAERREPVDWAMLAVRFDVKAQAEAQRRSWGATKSEVIFATPEVQRRMRRPDGSWTEGDWETIKTSPSYRMPAPPNIRMESDGKNLMVNKDDQRAADKYQEDLSAPQVQLAILRPLPPVFVADENPWKFPIITSYDDVLKQDDEYLFPNAPPSANPEDRYGVRPQAGKTATPKAAPRSPAEELSRELENLRAQLSEAKNNRSKNDATKVFNRALEISGDSAATADTKSKAEKLMKEAEQAMVDIEYGSKQQPVGPRTAAPDQSKPVREKLPHQDVWAYDAAVGSLTNGETYQYRIRVRVLNRLAGYPESFENPEDARQVFVASDWSEPTEPITFAPASWFFVTRADPSKRDIGVDFYQWYEGVWVGSRNAKFNEGDMLAFEDRVPVPSREDRSVAVTPNVLFEADARLLDIEFARPFRDRKTGTSAAGVRFGPLSQAPSAVFVDSKGRLEERVVNLDKDSPMKREVHGRKWVPPRK